MCVCACNHGAYAYNLTVDQLFILAGEGLKLKDTITWKQNKIQ